MTSLNATQQQTRRLLLHGHQAEPWTLQNPSSRTRRKNDAIAGRSALESAEAVVHDHSSPRPNGPPLSNLRSPSAFHRSTPPANSVHHTNPPNHVPPSPAAGQAGQSSSQSSSQGPEYTFVLHGQRDPSIRAIHARSHEDIERIDAIQKKGGVCGPCGAIRKQCDGGDHCKRCVKKRIPSYAKFLESLRPVSHAPELESISLHELESTSSSNSSPTEPTYDPLIVAQQQVAEHVNSWFKNVTRMIDPKPFESNHFAQHVTLEITSDDKGTRRTCFNLDFFEICTQVGLTAYQLEDDRLLSSFVSHPSIGKPPTPSHGELSSQCVRHLTWVICNTFAFLRSFPDADVFASINNMPAARATLSIVYASLYRLLLTKVDDFCSIVLKSLEHDFKYCLRKSRKDIVEDSLRGLAQYYRVVTGLANLELKSSSELMALFSTLRDQARKILNNDGLRDLIVKIHAKTVPRRARGANEPTQPNFKEIMSSYPSEVPEIKFLTIAVRVNPTNSLVRPTSTEAFRNNDPYHHHQPIKVRDLLKDSQNPAIHPSQVYVDNLMDNFDDLEQTDLGELGPSGSRPRHPAVQETIFDYDGVWSEPLSSSLSLEHASLRSSQQATDIRSVKSEMTVQNEMDVHDISPKHTSPEERSVDIGWRHVPHGKGCKRRERSDDSQHSRRGSGQGNRKHAKLDSGRESPPPYNYFDVLTYEPGVLP